MDPDYRAPSRDVVTDNDAKVFGIVLFYWISNAWPSVAYAKAMKGLGIILDYLGGKGRRDEIICNYLPKAG